MSTPHIAAKKPCLVTLKRKGKAYFWCQCGLSKSQPFCDGSHNGTGFEPLIYKAQKDGEEVLFCACKQTKNPPFCDGSHNALDDSYEEASPEDIAASASLPIIPPDEKGKAVLDGGCYVVTPTKTTAHHVGGWQIRPVIAGRDGARFLSQFLLQPGPDAQALTVEGSEMVLFLNQGSAHITIGGKIFKAGPQTGFYVRPGEGFHARSLSDTPIELSCVICPTGPEPTPLDTMPDIFDDRIPQRMMAMDPAKRQTMADRFYQVLVGEDMGSKQVTQFIGEIPRSRAAAHRHLYEEAITILSGEGFMWTENARAAVKPGDVIFLPKKQLHSLECTSESGMRLMGAFYPAGSPAINY
ncbi:hypothetical protein JCM17844_19490 [Iodidimonas gelatinilytica]|uniref:Iron-binding zinc finger CDGSH type domain-containing protein n=1 Tax=Iodidimonas gelatinilytica TaxID=1236966 RepID=A0A5A7MQI7_9PROT|nr:CDGSH iron-sulfur domain-containing protein [Iodidimonas gelatinilytica]GEQ98312.1 hypothetical protein JCM17844_19490 [Iodidimonas gelatinilytica]